MPSLVEILDAIWHKPNRPMAWDRIPAIRVIGMKAPAPFVPNDDYVIVRLSSMFLKNSRVLWLKLSPLAHATVTLNGRTAPRTDTSVIGPVHFGDLAAAPADRSIVLTQRVAGPAVWRGGDLSVAAGLFAVPKDQAVSALLDTIGQLSELALPGVKQGLEIAGVVKKGVEGLIGLNDTKPVFGVKVALGDPATAPAGSEAAPCVLAGIAAPMADVHFDTLWIRDGRLWEGASAAALRPYDKADYFLVGVEKGPARQDWRGLPALAPHEVAFDAVMRSTDLKKDAAAARLNEVFGPFDADLTAEEELTNPDKDRIRGEVIADLKTRLDRKFSGIFGTETRSVAGITRVIDPNGFNFLDVGDGGPEGAKPVPSGTVPF